MPRSFPLPRLPLLGLPQVAFHEIVKQFGLAETILFSLCSKRAHRLMQIHRNKSDDVQISLKYTSDDYHLIISQEGNRGKEYVKIHVFDGCITQELDIGDRIGLSRQQMWLNNGIRTKETCLNLVRCNWLDGIKIITEHITELFGKPIYEICLADKEYPDRVKALADWFMNRQNTVECMTCRLRNMSDEEISHILNGIIPTQTLSLEQGRGREYQINFPPYKLNWAKITGSVKLTLNQLKHFDCEIFNGRGSKMSMEDSNGFLKHWINGGSPRMQRFYIGTEAFDLAVMFDGIEMVERDHEVVRTFKYPNGEEKSVHGGFDITRNDDGKVATIQNYNETRAQLTYFLMIVWE